MDVRATEQNVQTGAPPVGHGGIGLRRAMLAPWRIFDPVRASAEMMVAGRGAAFLSRLLGTAVLYVLILVPPFINQSLVGANPYSPQYGSVSFKPAQALSTWSSPEGLRGLVIAAIITFLVIYGLIEIGSIHFAIQIHRVGRPRDTYRRGEAIASSGIGFLCFLVFMVFLTRFLLHKSTHAFGRFRPDDVNEWLLLFEIAIVVHLRWLAIAVDSCQGPPGLLRGHPSCEACGYNLFSLPQEGRCPECGSPIDQSLISARTGTLWQNCMNHMTFIETTSEVILHPRRFYRILRVGDHLRENRRFAIIHYAAIGLVTSMLGLCVKSAGVGVVQVLVFAMMFGLSAALVSYAVHRAMFSAAALVLFRMAWLPDVRMLRSVMEYESAYLWVIWSFNTGLVLLFSLGLPGDFVPATLAVGNLSIMGFWILRISRAVRAVRWSNF